MARVPLLGGSYTARSIISSAQREVNLYPEKNPSDAPVPVTHYPTAGLRLLRGIPLYSPPSPIPPPPVTGVFACGESCDILEFLLADTGNIPPQINIFGLTSTLEGPQGNSQSFTQAIDVDADGNQYVFNVVLLDDNVTYRYSAVVFSSGANGDIAPLQNIVGASTTFSDIIGSSRLLGTSGICVDTSKNIYVGINAHDGTTTILKFAANATGNVAPLATFATTESGIAVGSLFYDKTNSLVWANTVDGNVYGYNLDGTVHTNWSYGGFASPSQMSRGPDGSFYVADNNGVSTFIYKFSSAASGAVSPTSTLTIESSVTPVGVDVDSDGTIFVCWSEAEQFPPVSHITSYTAGSSGTPLPVTDVSGDQTGLNTLPGATNAPVQLRIHHVA